MIQDANGLDRIANARSALEQRLSSWQGTDGLWTGHLSSSAISTAVATLALDEAGGTERAPLAARGRQWLAQTIRPDGGWGDTPDSPSNLTAVLLARAALGRQPNSAGAPDALARSAQWLRRQIGGTDATTIRRGVLEHYGQDRTFAVPILVACALGNNQGQKPEAWKGIPPLPFELALMPAGFYRFLRLPVVSYAIPALIAVGLAQHRVGGAPRRLTSRLRELAVPRVLRILEAMQPTNGGFLEAAPLTGFVALSLAAAGEREHPVARKAVEFLAGGIREDGSWPIDTNLALWTTSLAVRALSGHSALAGERGERLRQLYLANQHRSVHPFTKAAPGGWAWTTLPGGVPDADDTAGALVALAGLGQPCSAEVQAGLGWLLDLANGDGGMPTFCRGWGRLPFDRSTPDISAHALAAYAAWQASCPPPLRRRLERGCADLRRYLQRTQDADGAWTPLWFGDQQAPGQRSRVYGTATVLEVLAGPAGNGLEAEAQRAAAWLQSVQNDDGGWGGDLGSPSAAETTGRAAAALAKRPGTQEAALRGALWICDQAETHGPELKPAPVGLYFASLWYDEALYPLLFALPALKAVEASLETQAPDPAR